MWGAACWPVVHVPANAKAKFGILIEHFAWMSSLGAVFEVRCHKRLVEESFGYETAHLVLGGGACVAFQGFADVGGELGEGVGHRSCLHARTRRCANPSMREQWFAGHRRVNERLRSRTRTLTPAHQPGQGSRLSGNGRSPTPSRARPRPRLPCRPQKN